MSEAAITAAAPPLDVLAAEPRGGETEAPAWDLEDIVSRLRAVRQRWREAQHRDRERGGREFPSLAALQTVMEGLAGALFPMRLGPADLRQESEDFYVGHTLDAALYSLRHQIALELRYAHRHETAAASPLAAKQEADRIAAAFAAALPEIRALLDTDVEAAFRGDPAARTVDEVVLCYPGLLAVIHHRIAHQLYRLGVPLVARIIAEIAHSATGIDIHPGARIGASFFIDHGTGVVIGETTVIGDRVRLYQAVTLGAKRFPVNEDGGLQKGLARHPVIEDDVVIYAGATLLGRITIGRGASIGGNVWLTRSVEAGSNVTQAHLQHTAHEASGRA
ncbi:serine acetyltransferase [Azoarcus sp. TTM-91]|uniref:serine O-acetyltransferase EpsC n=1 Tax=Azoarcus sp. TTM-91 TaxID=2691581 RepID=UPI00145C8628|nr:serine O-acetyltransferase EpsC [Azoarcus sp. TTM-91]NMG36671.1 serine acetyltransferase [Azoarcus sp. TTM-91]